MWNVNNIGTKVFLGNKIVYLQDRHILENNILENNSNNDMDENIEYKVNEYTEKLNRMTGRTTRIIDSTIQYMFKHPDEWIEIVDHFPTQQANKIVIEKINRRLKIEHNCKLIKNNKGLFKIEKI